MFRQLRWLPCHVVANQEYHDRQSDYTDYYSSIRHFRNDEE